MDLPTFLYFSSLIFAYQQLKALVERVNSLAGGSVQEVGL